MLRLVLLVLALVLLVLLVLLVVVVLLLPLLLVLLPLLLLELLLLLQLELLLLLQLLLLLPLLPLLLLLLLRQQELLLELLLLLEVLVRDAPERRRGSRLLRLLRLLLRRIRARALLRDLRLDRAHLVERVRRPRGRQLRGRRQVPAHHLLGSHLRPRARCDIRVSVLKTLSTFENLESCFQCPRIFGNDRSFQRCTLESSTCPVKLSPDPLIHRPSEPAQTPGLQPHSMSKNNLKTRSRWHSRRARLRSRRWCCMSWRAKERASKQSSTSFTLCLWKVALARPSTATSLA